MPERRYTLVADSPADRDRWVAGLRAAHDTTLASAREIPLQVEPPPTRAAAGVGAEQYGGRRGGKGEVLGAIQEQRAPPPGGNGDGEFVSGMSNERQQGVENVVGNMFGAGKR